MKNGDAGIFPVYYSLKEFTKTMSYGAGNPKLLKKSGGFRVSGERLHPSKNVSYRTLETEN